MSTTKNPLLPNLPIPNLTQAQINASIAHLNAMRSNLAGLFNPPNPPPIGFTLNIRRPQRFSSQLDPIHRLVLDLSFTALRALHIELEEAQIPVIRNWEALTGVSGLFAASPNYQQRYEKDTELVTVTADIRFEAGSIRKAVEYIRDTVLNRISGHPAIIPQLCRFTVPAQRTLHNNGLAIIVTPRTEDDFEISFTYRLAKSYSEVDFDIWADISSMTECVEYLE